MLRKITTTTTSSSGAPLRLRGATSTAQTSSSSLQSPVILEFSGHDTASIGYADTAVAVATAVATATAGRPKHTVSLPHIACLKTARDSEQVFLLYAAPLAELWNRLQPKGRRRVVVLHSQGLYVNRYWKLALCRLLHNVLIAQQQQQHQQTPPIEIAFVSALEMVPMVIVASTDNSNNNNNNENHRVTCLTVYLSATEAQCMVYAMGHGLEYTYQSCGYGCWPSWNQQNQLATTVQELNQLQQAQLFQNNNNNNSNNHGLVTALCLALQSCPVALRRAAVHNIVVAGTVLVPNFSFLLARRLHQFLTSEDTQLLEETKEDSKDTNDTAPPVVWTGTPIHKKALKPLSEYIAVVDTTGGVAPDILPWMGACLWSLQQQQQHQQHHQHRPNTVASDKTAAAPTTAIWNNLATEIEL